ncbi:4268_t:CDS:2, partial [Acaulospora morrowiae]
SIRANNNIHSVELSPTDANFPIQAYSASILTSSSLVTIPNSNDNNTLKVEPGGKGGFWGDLWRMSLIKEGKPTPKFWLILIVFLALTLLIVIPVVVATLSQSSPPPPPPSPSSPSSPQPSPPIKPNNNQTIASPV